MLTDTLNALPLPSPRQLIYCYPSPSLIAPAVTVIFVLGVYRNEDDGVQIAVK